MAWQVDRPKWTTLNISVKVLIRRFRYRKIYYTDARLLLVLFICVVIFVAEKQLLNTSVEIQVH